MSEAFKRLLRENPWPKNPPAGKVDPHGWLSEQNKEGFQELLADVKSPLILEIGTWMGLSATYFLKKFRGSKVITIDTFEGSPEHKDHSDWTKMIKGLHESAIRNLWDYRTRCCIIKGDSRQVLPRLFNKRIEPDLIYVDGCHEQDVVFEDVTNAIELFDCAVCGDDAHLDSVRKALLQYCIENAGVKFEFNKAFWKLA